LEAAKRELEEETGITAGKWELMGEAHLSNSVTDEHAVWYLATNLEQGRPAPEGTEQIEVRRVKLAEALRMALTGEITDALSVIAILQFHSGPHMAYKGVESIDSPATG
jgi:8-oxo-dGTP pyrophosphatase MutT (NUDIX family)